MPIMTLNAAQGKKLLTTSLERNRPVYVVKDDGAYAMVFGDKDDGTENVVEHQPKYNPAKNDSDEVYERCRRDFGGDDFGEAILNPTDSDDKQFMEGLLKSQDWKHFRIHVNPTTLKVSVK